MKHIKIDLKIFNSFLIFKKKKIFKVIAVKNKFFYEFCMNTNELDYQFDRSCCNIKVHKKNDLSQFILLDNINNIYKKFFYAFYCKIKFKGKGYRLQSFRAKKIMNFTFGHSHRYNIYLKNIWFKRLNKYKYLFLEKDLNIYRDFVIKLKNIKPINFYTLRGLRLSKQKITKRKGRKSPNLQI